MHSEYSILGESFTLVTENNHVLVNGEKVHYAIEKTGKGKLIIFIDRQTYEVEKLPETKGNLVVKVNQKELEVVIQNPVDKILEKIGLALIQQNEIKDVNSPMPGTILEILVKEGQQVKKGDPLVVLEAMKMENMIKSPRNGMIRSVPVTKGIIIEKNQPLVRF